MLNCSKGADGGQRRELRIADVKRELGTQMGLSFSADPLDHDPAGC